MKIYTRNGDSGFTSRADGSKVPKNDLLVSITGDFDSLNAAIGLSVSLLRSSPSAEHEKLGHLSLELESIQSLLTEAAAAVTGFRRQNLWDQDAAVRFTEERIDHYAGLLPALKEFILPGGHPGAAALHTARCECRRLERNLIAAELKAECLVFINRLSDYLFTAARAVNLFTDTNEIYYRKTQ